MTEQEVPGNSNAGAEEAFLDEVFDRSVTLIGQGQAIDIEELLAGRLHMRQRVEELVGLAQRVTPGRSFLRPTIAKYTILEELGSGGMGRVFLARQESLGGRPVALKVLPHASAISPRARQRFRVEAESIAKLRHPNIVAIFDVVDDGQTLAYAMEWVEGKPLAQLIREGERLEQTTACRLVIAVARALSAVHQAGLVHRDVKPSNILLRKDDTPLLSDFGLVRETDTTVVTQAGQFVGTLAYASPEQLRGEANSIDRRSDIYSLGVTLYHALCGRLPFKGRSTAEVLRQIEQGVVQPLRKADRRLPRDLQTIVHKAMDPVPGRRYQSADDLADDLERVLKFQPVHARPAGLLVRTGKLLRRNRLAMLGAVAGSVIALLAAGLLAVYLLVVPKWVDGHILAARIELLYPRNSERLLVTILWGADSQPQSVPDTALEAAIAEYARALWWSPFDDELRLEYETVQLAHDLGKFPSQAQPAALLQERAPVTARYAAQMASHSQIENVRASETTDPVDLRHLGLLAFLRGDMITCNDAWTRLNPVDHPDPLVDASLGELYLATGQPDRAYRYLARAYERAFADVGFICVDTAEAAIHVRDYPVAEWLIQKARGLSRLDPFGSLQRVEATYEAANGDPERAVEMFESVLRATTGLRARQAYGRLLVRQGQLREAVSVYSDLVVMRPTGLRYRQLLVGAADSWWESLDPGERLGEIRGTLAGDLWFRTMLLLYHESEEFLERQANDPIPWLATPEDEELARRSHRFASGLSAENYSLDSLAKRLDVTSYAAWAAIPKYPRVLKELQCLAWFANDPGAMSRGIRRLAVAWSAARGLIKTLTPRMTRPTMGTSWDVQYRVVDLGNLGFQFAYALDINEEGQVVGCAKLGADDPFFHAFLWSGDKPRLVNANGQRVTSQACAIDVRGHIAGSDGRPGFPAIWRAGIKSELPVAYEFSRGRGTARSMSDGGIAVGFCDMHSRERRRAHCWIPGPDGEYSSYVILPGLGDGASDALAVNNDGWIVGYADTVGGETHAVLWRPSGNGYGAPIELETLGGRRSGGAAINDSGQIVGWAEDMAGQQHATLWEGGKVTRINDLGPMEGTPVNAISIDEAGVIVGTVKYEDGSSWPYVVVNGRALALRSIIRGHEEWVSIQPRAANSTGQIVGQADDRDGRPHAVLLDPVWP